MMEWFRDFDNRTAVISGGGEGIGLEISRALLRLGCNVWFCGLDRGKGELAEELLGDRARFILADLAEIEGIKHFVHEISYGTDSVDYLVNNIANDVRIRFEDINEGNCDALWRVNLRSYLLLTRGLLDHLRKGKGKSVVNLGTTNYMLGLEPFTIYNATKSGILGFTRSLSRELGREGIRVNMVSPGWVMTEKQLREHVTEKDKEDLLRDQSLKQLITPEQIAPPILFLLSGAASAITGQNLVVDNGKYMQ
jgi:NAD(P)-dependent dehydrogenase (short-subunit alcohol dehydrogenase family)